MAMVWPRQSVFLVPLLVFALHGVLCRVDDVAGPVVRLRAQNNTSQGDQQRPSQLLDRTADHEGKAAAEEKTLAEVIDTALKEEFHDERQRSLTPATGGALNASQAEVSTVCQARTRARVAAHSDDDLGWL